MDEFAMNIDDFSVGQFVKDLDMVECEITKKGLNNIEVLIKKKTKVGINHKQWFNMQHFNRRFKK